jgi:hypothetical protein
MIRSLWIPIAAVARNHEEFVFDARAPPESCGGRRKRSEGGRLKVSRLRRSRWILRFTWLTVAALLFLGGRAYGGSNASGTTDSWGTARWATGMTQVAGNTNWSTLSGSSFTVSGSDSYLYGARFGAETSCRGSSGFCSVRIAARNNSTGVTFLLEPYSSNDLNFYFDSVGPSDDGSETHGIERFLRLGEGSWTFSVQVRVSRSDVTFRLDEWVFAVERRL